MNVILSPYIHPALCVCKVLVKVWPTSGVSCAKDLGGAILRGGNQLSKDNNRCGRMGEKPNSKPMQLSTLGSINGTK